MLVFRNVFYSVSALQSIAIVCLIIRKVSIHNLRNSLFKGPLKYLLMPLLGKHHLAITLHMYASIGPNLGNTHQGQILSSL